MQKNQEEWVTPQEQTCADIVIKRRIFRVPSYLTGLVNGHAQIVDGHNYITHTSLKVGFGFGLGLAHADQVTTIKIGPASKFTVGGFRESFHLISRWESYATMSSRWVSYDPG